MPPASSAPAPCLNQLSERYVKTNPAVEVPGLEKGTPSDPFRRIAPSIPDRPPRAGFSAVKPRFAAQVVHFDEPSPMNDAVAMAEEVRHERTDNQPHHQPPEKHSRFH